MSTSATVSMLTHMGATRDKVKYCLKTWTETRDNDDYLVAIIWHAEMKKLGLDPLTTPAFKLFQLMKEQKLPHAESIRRQRQKLQEDFSELRGPKWYDRKAEASKVHQAAKFGDL